VLGGTEVPIRQILQMSRGAMIALDGGPDEPTQLYVNGELVANGRVLVQGQRIALEVTDVVKKRRN
jgi:flagellar motor switch protein FliN